MHHIDPHLSLDDFLISTTHFSAAVTLLTKSESPDFGHKRTGKYFRYKPIPNLKPRNLLHSASDSVKNAVIPKLLSRDQINLMNLLKTLTKEKSLGELRRIHAYVLEKSLISDDVYLANALISAYSKCGALNEAREVLEQIPRPNVVSWNALISGYVGNKDADEALKCFRQMKDAGICPDAMTYASVLKACGIMGSLEVGKDIDAEIREQGLLKKDVVLGTALVGMYCKCGAMMEAQAMFYQLSERNVVTWNALITGYVHNKLGDEALKCYRQMVDAGACPDKVTYASALRACGIIGSIEIGGNIDVHVRKQGLLDKDVVLGTALVDMYSKCGALDKALEVFQLLPKHNVISWNALMDGYVNSKLGDEALNCFRMMKDTGVSPDAVTYMLSLKACSIVGAIDIGESIDAEIRKLGLLKKNVMLGNALMDMYCKCGALEKARELFPQLPARDVLSWNILITGYAQNGLGDEALKCYRQMRDAEVSPDEVTYVCILKSCGIVGSLEIGEEVSSEVRNRGWLKGGIVLGNALVDMYSKCGIIEKAREVFEQLPEHNIVSWNSLIAGYTRNELGEEALQCFLQMRDAGVCPDEVTYVCILKACGIVGSLAIGQKVDAEVRKKQLLAKNIMLGSAFIDMYSKCGALDKAQELFEHLPVWDVVCWNAMIAGHGQLGQANVAFYMYRRMLAEEIGPDLVTFVVLLNTCSHAGLLKEGEALFDEMSTVYHLKPTLEHYACMIDLFGRAGQFTKLKSLLNKVPPSGNLPLLQSILSSCRKWRNVKFARWAFEELILLNERCSAAYVSMGNIYAMAGMEKDAELEFYG